MERLGIIFLLEWMREDSVCGARYCAEQGANSLTTAALSAGAPPLCGAPVVKVQRAPASVRYSVVTVMAGFE